LRSDEVQRAQVIKERLFGSLCFLGVSLYQLSVRLLKFLAGTENSGMVRTGTRRVSKRFASTDRSLPFLEVGSLVFQRVNHVAMYGFEALGYGECFELYNQSLGASLIIWEGNTSLAIRLKPCLSLDSFNNSQIQ
jgi:hypothetical protein